MIEKLLIILDKVMTYLILLLDRPFIEFTLIDIVIAVAMVASIYFFIKHAVKAFFAYGIKGAGYAAEPVKRLYKNHKKNKSNKKVCSVCRNPIHDCTCPRNKGVSYRKRIKAWKKEKAVLVTEERLKRKNLKELNKPVELKQRNRGGR